MYGFPKAVATTRYLHTVVRPSADRSLKPWWPSVIFCLFTLTTSRPSSTFSRWCCARGRAPFVRPFRRKLDSLPDLPLHRSVRRFPQGGRAGEALPSKFVAVRVPSPPDP
eukprot:9157535-Pyramimonas_sp.AAC.1